ncbi:MAG: tetratricopeptide repeat protein [Pseudomonadales bacterium]|jgi:serine/threonine-protein kinase|nr:tetratricopeptide repeat protein [Pseudomonadales bacterium]
MDGTDRARRLRALFQEALAQDADAREPWLARQCGDDAALLEELRALLQADDRTDGILRDAVADAARAVPTGTPPFPLPKRLGPWRVLHLLGQGGMGEVWLGERADGRWTQQVAIKRVAHRGARDLVERFRAERRILGRLRHPGIARLLDGGETPDGTPYLVMEYVDGAPVDAWCDARRLPVDARLRLFLKICDAVQHAHQALVIHRDLKPSNILVTADGEPRLLDFGIAKLIAEDEEGPSAETRSGLRVMTPRTASPEQIRGDALTTATDVYGLGLLLHALLAGDLPYATDGVGIAAFYRTVLEAEPERPGATLARLRGEDRAETIARARGTTTPRLLRRLQGDLERIVQKALRKEPERRYATVRSLADDIEAHLALRPVSARADDWRYRTGRFLRRNRAGVVAASVALFAAAAFGSYHAVRISEERDIAQRERTTAERVTEFLIATFDVADPASLPGETVTAREIVDRGGRRIRAMADTDPMVRVRLLEALARVYAALGLYGDARPLLTQGMALAKDAGLEPRIRERLAFREAESIGYGGAFEAGIDALRAALVAADAPGANALRDRVEARIDLADMLQRYGDLEAATAEIDRAVKAALALTEDDALLADALGVRGAIRTVAGDLDGAEADLEQAYALTARTRGADHWRLPDLRHELAGIDFYRGDYPAALEELEAAIAEQERLLGAEHPAVGRSLGSLASLLWAMEDLEQAEAVARDALRVTRLSMGPNHDDVIHANYTLASIIRERNRFEEAETLLLETLARQRAVNAPNDPELGNTLASLAEAQFALGKLDVAEASLRDSIALQEASLGPTHLWVAISYRQLAVQHLLRGDIDAALALSAKALDRARPDIDPAHPQLAAMYRDHGRALVAAGQPEAAERAIETALDIYRNADRKESVASAQLALAEQRIAAGQPDEALSLSSTAIETLEELRGADAPSLSEALIVQAQALAELGDFDRLATIVDRARTLRAGVYGASHPLNRKLERLAALAEARVGA